MSNQEKIYTNADRKCICFKCELKGKCKYVDKFQRLGREQGGLGLCHKLEENQRRNVK